MKKLIPIFLAVLCLTACGNEQVKNPDTLSTAVISSSDSVSGFFTCSFPHAVRQSTARNIGISFFKNFLLLKCLIYKCTVTGKEYTY